MAGRGKIPTSYGDRNIPMRRPGEPAAVGPEALASRLGMLKFDADDERNLTKCMEIYERVSFTKQAIDDILRIFHSNCIQDGKFGRKVALLLAAFEQQGVDSRTLRNRILQSLQEQFETKMKLAESDRNALLNSVILHGEIYHSIRAGGQPLKVLATPLLQYLTLLLTLKSQAASAVILQQLVINHKFLKDQESESFETFLVTLRSCIAKTDLTANIRMRLMLALEVAVGSFTFKGGSLTRDFYCKELLEEFKELECRVLGVPYKPPTASEQQKALGLVDDLGAVRDRMRAKGLLPRLPARQEPKIKDDEFYGIQIPKTDKKFDLQEANFKVFGNQEVRDRFQAIPNTY